MLKKPSLFSPGSKTVIRVNAVIVNCGQWPTLLSKVARLFFVQRLSDLEISRKSFHSFPQSLCSQTDGQTHSTKLKHRIIACVVGDNNNKYKQLGLYC